MCFINERWLWRLPEHLGLCCQPCETYPGSYILSWFSDIHLNPTKASGSHHKWNVINYILLCDLCGNRDWQVPSCRSPFVACNQCGKLVTFDLFSDHIFGVFFSARFHNGNFGKFKICSRWQFYPRNYELEILELPNLAKVSPEIFTCNFWRKSQTLPAFVSCSVNHCVMSCDGAGRCAETSLAESGYLRPKPLTNTKHTYVL